MFFYQERTAEDSRESDSFRQLLEARTHEFVEEVLMPHFGAMMMFVKDAESRLERGQADMMKNQDRKSSSVLASSGKILTMK